MPHTFFHHEQAIEKRLLAAPFDDVNHRHLSLAEDRRL
jgi:hypothetical protein